MELIRFFLSIYQVILVPCFVFFENVLHLLLQLGVFIDHHGVDTTDDFDSHN